MGNDRLIINDVGPRDGLQNQPKVLDITQRKQLIEALIAAHVPDIEVGAFVSPKAVPAMANTGQLLSQLPANAAHYSVLIPNLKGYQLALEAGAKCMSLVVAASDTMNQRNIGMSTAETLEVCQQVFELATNDKVKVQAYVATAWVCPFEGDIAADEVKKVSAQLLQDGASRLVIADTIGAAAPNKVKALMQDLTNLCPAQQLACHFHDTRAMALANVFAALEADIRHYDAAIAGLGGCPFAPGASGNVATEDLVLLAEQMGLHTGIDMGALLSASDLAIELTGTATGGKAKGWLEKYHTGVSA